MNYCVQRTICKESEQKEDTRVELKLLKCRFGEKLVKLNGLSREKLRCTNEKQNTFEHSSVEERKLAEICYERET